MKIKFLLMLTVQFLIALVSHSQVTFQKLYGQTDLDEGNCVKQTPGGGYIVVGTSVSPTLGNYRIDMLKTDANGDTLFTKLISGPGIQNRDLRGASIFETSDGGYIIGGYIYAWPNGTDIYLLKTDSNGITTWSESFGGSSNDMGLSVVSTFDGGYAICGEINLGSDDVSLIRTDSSGVVMWTKTYGSDMVDQGSAVQQTSDSGFIITGSSNLGVGNINVYLLKVKSTGDTLWARTFGGTDWLGDAGRDVKQTFDGGYIVVGTARSFGAGNDDVYLVKTDAAGDLMWSRTYGGGNSDDGNDVEQTADSGYIIVGTTGSFGGGNDDIYLVKTDKNGDTLWTRAYGDSNYEQGLSVQQTADGGYIVTGSSNSFGSLYGDVYLVKTDMNGNSGCHEYPTATIVSIPATQVTHPHTSYHNANTMTTTSLSDTSESGGSIHSICARVGIEEPGVWKDLFSIFPNPASDAFVIKLAGDSSRGKMKNILIYNLLGEKIYSCSVMNDEVVIPCKQMSKGIYFVELFNEEMKSVQKLVIQ